MCIDEKLSLRFLVKKVGHKHSTSREKVTEITSCFLSARCGLGNILE